jgi:hypothetical protein
MKAHPPALAKFWLSQLHFCTRKLKKLLTSDQKLKWGDSVLDRQKAESGGQSATNGPHHHDHFLTVGKISVNPTLSLLTFQRVMVP